MKNTSKKMLTLAERARLANYAPPPPKYASEIERDYTALLVDPGKTALVNIDITNLFTEPGALFASPEAPKIIPNVNKLAKYCRRQGIPVIWIRWVSRRDGSDLGIFAKYYSNSPALTEHMSVEDSYWSQLYRELDVQPDDIFVKKPKYDAFWGTDFEAVLRGLQRESLIFTGIMTDVCVQVTLIDAFHRDFNPILVEDATDTPWPYKKEAIWYMELLYSRVLTTDEVIAELKALAP